MQKCQKCICGSYGSLPPPDPLAGFQGPTSKGREGWERDGDERGGEGIGRAREGKKGGEEKGKEGEGGREKGEGRGTSTGCERWRLPCLSFGRSSLLCESIKDDSCLFFVVT